VVSAIDAPLQRGAVFCYKSQNVAEFWNTCTRQLDRNGYGLSPQEADRRARFFEDKLRLLPPDSLAVHQEWCKTGGCEQISGVHVHDARFELIAATIVSILTLCSPSVLALFARGHWQQTEQSTSLGPCHAAASCYSPHCSLLFQNPKWRCGGESIDANW
jgi:hypothetical protein